MDNYVEQMDAHRDIEEFKFQLRQLKFGMLVARQEELYLNEMIEHEKHIAQENEIYIRFADNLETTTNENKKKVTKLYVNAMNNQLSSQVDMVLDELIEKRTEASNKRLEQQQKFHHQIEEKLKKLPMARAVLKFIADLEEADSIEINRMERQIAIDSAKINVCKVEKEKWETAYRPQYDEQVKELHALEAELRELDEPNVHQAEPSAHEAIRVDEENPRRRLSGVLSQPTRTQAPPLVQVEQEVVIEPDFVKMEIEEDPEFDMFNTSDESNEQIPSPQPPRLVQPRAPPAAGTVQETRKHDTSPRKMPSPLQSQRTMNDGSLSSPAPQSFSGNDARVDPPSQLAHARPPAAAGTAQRKHDSSPRKVPNPMQALPNQVSVQSAGGNNARDNPPRSKEANMDLFVTPSVPVANKRKEGPIGSSTPAKKPNYGAQQRRPPPTDFDPPSRHAADNRLERSPQLIETRSAPKAGSSKPVASKTVSPQVKEKEPDAAMANAGSRSIPSKAKVQSSDRSDRDDMSRLSIGSNDSISNHSIDGSLSFVSAFSGKSRSNRDDAQQRGNNEVDDFNFDDISDVSFADASFDNRSFDGENSDFGDGGDLPTASNEFQFENADGNADEWSTFADFP